MLCMAPAMASHDTGPPDLYLSNCANVQMNTGQAKTVSTWVIQPIADHSYVAAAPKEASYINMDTGQPISSTIYYDDNCNCYLKYANSAGDTDVGKKTTIKTDDYRAWNMVKDNDPAEKVQSVRVHAKLLQQMMLYRPWRC